jgi:hypothetical protein
MSKATTVKALILAESARIIELLNLIPDENLKYSNWEYSKEKAELKAKMAELRRDTIALEKILYTYGGCNE